MMRKLLRAIRRLLGGKVAGGGPPRGGNGGGTAGVREPRRPVPPDNQLGGTRPIEPDPKTITLPDARQ
ncbi:hypothetical protein [Nocardia sp. CS682]|uniref:hypothetical protein n=1 Tax=Nocardia sp. CS682 TaxID=1047172 RepID=UPI001075523F|nr:hypothetical protein [Nocardia sp. CS682]QBS43700.1 hypothetical protein DMB37_29980 [Nocardia sp. CS682]